MLIRPAENYSGLWGLDAALGASCGKATFRSQPACGAGAGPDFCQVSSSQSQREVPSEALAKVQGQWPGEKHGFKL